jgi:CRP/FNR family cyclic AMP-dependent transcriptional regulator
MAYEFDVAEVQRLCPESTTVTLEAGAVLFHEGDPGDALYVLLTGALKISGGNTVYETVSPGGVVGEMAIVQEGYPRSASVIAITRSEVLRIEPETFLSLVSGNPDFALNLLRISTRRLRKMNKRHLRPSVQVSDIPLEAVSAG